MARLAYANENKAASKSQVKKPVTKPALFSLGSRVNFNLLVATKSDSFILAPRGRTAKQFKDGDILTVEGHSLQQAIAMGYVTIVR